MSERQHNGNKLLTIVVPVYNVEKYLKQCLDSFLVGERIEEIEILIIDDGSPDQSCLIAEKYQLQFPNSFRVISKRNGGHGSVINRGICEAKGKYFKIVDGDDWVETSAFKKFIHYLEETDSDIVYSNYVWVDETSGHKMKEIEEAFKGVRYRYNYRFDDISDKLYIKMHSMTIKTDLLKRNKVKLDEGCYYVDTEYVTYPIPFIETISFFEDDVYMYRVGRLGQSVNLRSMQRRIADHLKVIDSLIKFYKKLLGNNTRNDFGSIPKQDYIRKMISRVIVSQYKIYLSFQPSKDIKRQLLRFDIYVKNSDTILYKTASNGAVYFLRTSKFNLYFIIATIVRIVYWKQLFLNI